MWKLTQQKRGDEMKEMIFGGLVVMVVMLAGISLAHENAGGFRFHQNVCSETNAVACILHGKRIPNN